MLRYVPFTPTWVRVFVINGYWILSNAFSESAEMILGFSLFALLMCYITLILHVLNSPYELGMHSTWMWCMIFSCVGVSLLIFCWEFLHLYSMEILACDFLFWWYLVWFWYQGDGGFIEYLWECSLQFCEDFEKDWYKFFLYIWLNLSVKPSSPGLLFVGKFLKKIIYFLIEW